MSVGISDGQVFRELRVCAEMVDGGGLTRDFCRPFAISVTPLARTQPTVVKSTKRVTENTPVRMAIKASIFLIPMETKKQATARLAKEATTGAKPSIKTAPTRRKPGRSSPVIDAQTDSGGIRLGQTRPAPIRARADSGGVTLKLASRGG